MSKDDEVFYTANGQRILLVVIAASLAVGESVGLDVAVKSDRWPLAAIVASTLVFGLGTTFRTVIQCGWLNSDSLIYRGALRTQVIALREIEHTRIAPAASAWSTGFAVELLFGSASGRKPISLLPTAAWSKDTGRLEEIAGKIEAAVLASKAPA